MISSYQPANGTEGRAFEEQWCERCKRDQAFRDGYACGIDVGGEDGCQILADAQIFDISEPEYPAEWVEDETGPRCTAFEPIDNPYRCDKTPDLFSVEIPATMEPSK